MKKHPMQPIVWVDDVTRFKENKLVRILLDHGRDTGMGLNELSIHFWGEEYKEDWNQLAQLIGYSVSGFGDLSYADEKIVNKADAISDKMGEKKRGKK
jgi:hypothetical protein